MPMTPNGTFLNAVRKFNPAIELLTRFATARRRGEGLRRGALLFLVRLLAIVVTRPFVDARRVVARRVGLRLVVDRRVVRRFVVRFVEVRRFVEAFFRPLRRGFKSKISLAGFIL
jgi:hypothetical protein